MVKIGIIDSGVNEIHLSGSKNIKGEYLQRDENTNLIQSSKDIVDRNGHGNECFRIISSIISEADYFIAKVFGEKLETEIDVLVAAIEACVAERVNVISISAGIRSDKIPEQLRAVCDEAYDNNIIIVAAQHNEGFHCYPAKYCKVISVGSIDLCDGELYRFNDNCEFFTSAAELYPPTSQWSRSTSFACAKMTAYVACLINEQGEMKLDRVKEKLTHYAIKGL